MKSSIKRRVKNCIRGVALLVCFIAIWYVASCFTTPLFIPAPAAVWRAIVGLAETGQLQKGLLYSYNINYGLRRGSQPRLLSSQS